MIICVTGTDTGVGKTVATAALAARALGEGSVVVVKPVQTGIGAGEEGDVDAVHRLTGAAAQEYTALREPLAPDTAARLEGVRLPTVAEYADRIRVLAEFHDTVIVEGAGGVLVHLDSEDATIIDLALACRAEVVVVTRAGLGTLNHTGLTVNELRRRGIEPSGLIIGAEEAGLAAETNRSDLPGQVGVPIIATLPPAAGVLSREDFLAAAPTWFA